MFIFYRRYYLTITPWPIERMQLLTCGLAGFYGRPDNNRRAKVLLFYFMANVCMLFFLLLRTFSLFFMKLALFPKEFLIIVSLKSPLLPTSSMRL